MQVRKIQIIFMGMLTQPQELVIGKVFPLNLATFTSVSLFDLRIASFFCLIYFNIVQIMKGAYSMFNILLSLK